MQKKIIALAVIAAAFSAPAFADVTMYGQVDAAVAHVGADGKKGDIVVVSGGLASSRIGAKSVEDIGNGMKVVALVEYALDTETNTGIATARQQMLAVAGDFGTVATGYLQTAAYDQAVKFDPTAGSLVSPLQSATKGKFMNGAAAVAARAPRALAYISPDLSGVTLAWNYTADFNGGLGNATTAGDTKTSAYLLSAAYAAGPVAASAVYTNVTAAGTSVVTEISLGASYDLGMVKLMGTYQTKTKDNAGFGGKGKAYSLSAVAPVGPGAVAVTYAANKMDAANSSGKGFTVGYLQGLSKTVTAYAALERTTNDSGSSISVANNVYGAGMMGGTSTLIAVGLNKKF